MLVVGTLYRGSNHALYDIKDHIVWITKYRKPALRKECLRDFVKRFACLTILIFLLMLFITATPASAKEKMFVAVAASYIQAFSKLAERYEEATGTAVQATFASTGNLYNQIKNGAPYDLFLAADESRPRLLREEGLCDEPFVYARGRAILWSANHDFCNSADWKEALKNSTGRIALANPLTAPYGTVALEALRKTDLERAMEGRFVTAQSVPQSFRYASTGAVDAGFCALSAVGSEEGRKGCYYLIPEAEPVVQAACVLGRRENRKAAERFAAFVVSDEALKIRETFGYE
jgi:molybdate transport system substrate-binding protein